VKVTRARTLRSSPCRDRMRTVTCASAAGRGCCRFIAQAVQRDARGRWARRADDRPHRLHGRGRLRSRAPASEARGFGRGCARRRAPHADSARATRCGLERE
jgi:hypothetical protein